MLAPKQSPDLCKYFSTASFMLRACETITCMCVLGTILSKTDYNLHTHRSRGKEMSLHFRLLGQKFLLELAVLSGVRVLASLASKIRRNSILKYVATLHSFIR